MRFQSETETALNYLGRLIGRGTATADVAPARHSRPAWFTTKAVPAAVP